MDSTVVDRLYIEFSDLISVLDNHEEVSLRIVADDNLRKSLLMAAASYFERCMTDALMDFVSEVTSKGHVITWFVKNKAVSRQYHQWFDWSQKNANSFFGLFGEEFKKYTTSVIAKDNNLNLSIQAFLEVGSERNRLVHQDFGSFTLEKTCNEIYNLYKDAMRFVDWFPKAIRQFSDELKKD